MGKITKLLFDLKRELEDRKETYYDPAYDYTDIERKEGYDKHEKAVDDVGNLIDSFNVSTEDDLNCDIRLTRGHLNRCDYCAAYSNEKCRWEKQ